MSFPEAEQRETLARLGFEVDGDEVTVPTWRALDVTRPVDLVEEVVRFRIEEVPSTLPARDAVSCSCRRSSACAGSSRTSSPAPASPRRTPGASCPRRRGGCRSRSPTRSTWRRCARISASACSSRPERNRNAGVEEIALFEIARVYRPPGSELPEERWHVAAITEGGFFRAKGAAESLHRRAGRAARRASSAGPAARRGRTTASSPSSPAAGATSSSTWTRSSRPRPTRSPTPT